MNTIFMNSKNGKTSDPHRLLLNLTDKIDEKKGKYIALSNLSIYYTWKNVKKLYKNNKRMEKWHNPSIRKYINKIESRIMFKVKTEYYLELLTLEPMKLLGSTKSKIIKDENVSYLEFTEVVLIHCNVELSTEFKSLVYTNKSLGQLLDISP